MGATLAAALAGIEYGADPRAAVEEDMCERGFASGNPQKPYFVVSKLAGEVTPEGTAPLTEVAAQATLALKQERQKEAALAKLALGVCIVAGLATVAYSTVKYEAMPDRVPTHFGVSGEADAWTEKSVVSVMLAPTMNLVLCPFLALLALLTAHAKRSIRGGAGGRSVEAQNAFRGATANLLSGTALVPR